MSPGCRHLHSSRRAGSRLPKRWSHPGVPRRIDPVVTRLGWIAHALSAIVLGSMLPIPFDLSRLSCRSTGAVTCSMAAWTTASSGFNARAAGSSCILPGSRPRSHQPLPRVGVVWGGAGGDGASGSHRNRLEACLDVTGPKGRSRPLVAAPSGYLNSYLRLLFQAAVAIPAIAVPNMIKVDGSGTGLGISRP